MTNRTRSVSTRFGAVVFVAAVLMGSALVPAVASSATPTYSKIALRTPWVTANFDGGNGVPSAALDSRGIVHLSGAAYGGSNDTTLGILAPKFRPTMTIYVPMAIDDGDSGELEITPDGTMTPFGSPMAYASLSTISFASATATPKPVAVTLQHGWTFAPSIYDTGRPKVSKLSNGIVRLSGSLSGGVAGTTAFVLPAADRPPYTIDLPVDTFNETNGYIEIRPSGAVQPIGSDVDGFVSLAGVTFVAAARTIQMNNLDVLHPYMLFQTPAWASTATASSTCRACSGTRPTRTPRCSSCLRRIARRTPSTW